MTTHPLTLRDYSLTDHERDRAFLQALAQVARSGSSDARADALWLLTWITAERSESQH